MAQRYFQPEIETASREQITEWQTKGLIWTVKHSYDHIPYYRNLMDEKGVKPEDIKCLEDIVKLPFLSKEDLRKNYPYGMLAIPRKDVVRLQSTSGTTGKRVIAYYTHEDIKTWDECCARSIVAAGGTNEDVVHVCYGYGLFTGGPGLNGGSHMVGSLTVPMSSGNTDRQIQFLIDLEATIICCTPSYAAYIGETICDRGLQDKLKLKAGIFGAEAWSEEMRQDIQKKLGIKAYNIYGLTETCGPGLSWECSEQDGSHIQEDHFIPEIIDPATGEVLPDGEEGELVITSVDKVASPIVRYRTHDICTLTHEKCRCGRTHARMSRIVGRTDDMLVVKGVNVFPSQIETVLMNNGYPANYEIVVSRENNSDVLDVKVEMTPEMFSDNLSDINAREKVVVAALKSMLGIYANVHLVAPKSITRSEGKAVRVIDKRGLWRSPK